MKISIVCLLGILVTVYSGPVPHAEDDGKLDGNVTPLDYNIELTISKDDLTEYTGVVTIHLKLAADSKTITLHSVNEIPKDKIKLLDKDKADTKRVVEDVTDAGKERITITFKDEVPQGEYYLQIKYSGNINDSPTKGFYRSTFKSGDKDLYVASTQFEPTSARKAFPCFDQPEYRTPFTLTISVPNSYNVLSNTKGEKTEDNDKKIATFKFDQTPPMSTYLVAFVIHPNDGYTCDADGDNHICSRFKDQMSFAKTLVPKVVSAMGDYTGKTYDQFKLGKLDNVAIPNFAAGAMENWGLVTYREAALLSDATSSEKQKQKVAQTIMHELSHQWFGDFVTLKWWNEVFLNEGFATYFQYHLSGVSDTDKWELENQFVVEELQTALEYDASDSSKPLISEPEITDVSARFDDISYNKGGSILRMVAKLMGDNFKAGLIEYLKDGPKSVTADDLWKALQSKLDTSKDIFKDVKLSDVMNSWTTEQGFPLVTVSISDDNKKITIKQDPVNTNKKDKVLWKIPVFYFTDKNDEAFIWLNEESVTLPVDMTDQSWIVLNNQKGYYRVKYDDKLWKKIAKDFDNEKLTKPVIQAQLLDDFFYLYANNKVDYAKVFETLELLKKNNDYYVWVTVFRAFDNMLNKIDNLGLKHQLKMKFLSFSEHLSTETGEDHIPILKQILIKERLCKLNNGKCIEDAKTKFDVFLEKGTEIAPNERSYVLCHGFNNTDNKDAWTKLWEKYTASTSTSVRNDMLTAFGCNGAYSAKYLQKLLDNSILSQDRSTVYNTVLSNTEGVTAVFQFIATSDWKNKLTVDEIKALISLAAKKITNSKQIDELKKINNDDLKEAVSKAVEAGTNNIKVVNDAEKTLSAYLSPGDDNDGAVGVTISTAALLLTVFLSLYQLS